MRRHDGIAMIQGMFALDHMFPNLINIGTTLFTSFTFFHVKLGRPIQDQIPMMSVPHHGGIDHAIGVGPDHGLLFFGGYFGIIWCGHYQIFQNHVFFQVICQSICFISKDQVVAVFLGQSPFFISLFGGFWSFTGPGNQFHIFLFHNVLVMCAQLFQIIVIILAPGSSEYYYTAKIRSMNCFIQPLFGVRHVLFIVLSTFCHFYFWVLVGNVFNVVCDICDGKANWSNCGLFDSYWMIRDG
mmetsp:Transcript_5361/g.11356  ORF Transcript_5361/g.11356 Transcript_5361/m.11356 type:complete len:241 (+) Transcript_5361:130-852(+)